MKVFNLINNKEFKRVFGNFFYLSVTNFANFVLPLITFPYLVQKLGVSNFGLLAFATAIITYFQTLTDFGFNLTATRQVTVNRFRPSKLSTIVSAVFAIKLLFLMLSSLILLFLVAAIPKFQEHSSVYFYTFGLVIGQCLFPSWFFQGIEKIRIISILNLFSKIFFTFCIFIFINVESDFYLVPIINSLGQISIGIVAIVIMLNKYKVKIKIPTITQMDFYFKDGWHIFISNISVTLYSSAIITILGFFSNNIIVGYYSVADKVIQIFRSFLAPLSQAVFPYLSSIALTSREKVLSTNFLMLKCGLILMICISLGIYYFANDIIFIVMKKDIAEASAVLKILSPIPVLIFLANIFALFTMIVFARNRQYSKIIVSAGIISIILSFIMIPLFTYIGAAITVLLIEIYVTLRYVFYVQNSDLKLKAYG